MSNKEDFSRYMNKSECPIQVGESYYRTDLLFCDVQYTVLEIIEESGKYYAMCSYLDSFTEKEEIEKVYAFYLSKSQN